MTKQWAHITNHFGKEPGKLQDRFRLRPAVQTLQELINKGQSKTVDFVFIDADKKNYCEYDDKSLALIRRGGVIAIDNVLWRGKTANPDIHDDDTTTIEELNSMETQSCKDLVASDGELFL